MKRITPDQAAKILKTSAQTVRYGMQQGTLPIGTIIKRKRHVYLISEDLLKKFMENGAN